MEETLLEYADCTGLALNVDRERGVIRGVKILGLESRNGRTYAADAVARARELYEGAKVNVNHPKGNPAAPRDYQDRIGVVHNVTFTADAGLFGDLHYNPQHALAGQLEWDARNAPENVGLSHNVLARTSRRDERLVVESITRVLSVDLVADPATTRGLYEELDPATAAAAATNDASTLQTLTVERLREQRSDLVETLLAEAKTETERLGGEITALRRLLVSVRPPSPPTSREQRRVDPPPAGPTTVVDFVRLLTRGG